MRMRSIFLYVCLVLFPAHAYAAASGVDLRVIRDRIDFSCERLGGRLDLADAGFRQLISTPVIAAADYAVYRATVAAAGDEMKALAKYDKGFAGLVAKLGNAMPAPDDLPQLRELGAYAAKKESAARDRCAEMLKNQDKLAVKLAWLASVLQPGARSVDPRTMEREKAQQLKVLENARAMDDKEKEFNAIKDLSGLDPQEGGRMMSSFFDGLSAEERGKFGGEFQAGAAPLKKPDTAAAADLNGPAALQPAKPRVAVLPDHDAPSLPADRTGTSFGMNDVKLGLWSAADKFAPSLAVPHLRETKLTLAADAKTDWLEKKRRSYLDLAGSIGDPAEKARYAGVAGNIQGLIDKRGAAGRGDVDERSAALGEWNTSVSRLMDDSHEGQSEKALVDKKASLDAEYAALKTDEDRALWIKAHGQEYEDAGKELAGFYVENPEYLKARKTEADAQIFMRSRMADFKDGTEFVSDELGLELPPGQKVTVSRSPEGAVSGDRGISYTDDKGLRHFQSFDDQVRVNEVLDPSGEKRSVEMRLSKDGAVNIVERRPGGRLFRTEEHRPDGTVALEVYGEDGKAAASKMLKPDGSRIDAVVLGKEGLKRTIFTDPQGAGTFTVEPLSGQDGYPRQSGRVVDGRLVLDKVELDAKTVKARVSDYVFETKADGKSSGFELDCAALKILPADKRGEAARSAAAVLSGGDAAQAGPLKQFIAQAAGQAGPNDQLSITTAKDDKGNTVYLANILTQEGYQKQVLGQWDKLSKDERAGLPSDVGLDISVRSAAKGEDINKRQCLKLFRFDGDNLTDRYCSEGRVTGNWFTGYGAVQDNYVYRVTSDTHAGIKRIATGTETLYSSPNILGQTGIAIGTMGKGAVQLTSSALAVASAGTIGWADKNLQDELLERAKSNFYGNEVSRNLGRNYLGDRYEEGYAKLDVKEDHNIQNVGREMASMGKPTLGAVLQGGVEFSNGVATTLVMAPLGGPVSGALGKTGTVGTVAGKAYGSYQAVKGIYKTGASGVEFVQACRAFDENDPASKERYYAAVTGLTASALNSPKTLSGAFKLSANIKDAKNALTGKDQSPVLGPDGKPFVKPPEEPGGFSSFMLGKNGPGLLTRVMTKDISGGLDPKISLNLANNPVSTTANSVEKWASGKVDRWLGKPVDTPRPGLIVPGQVQPNPDARIIVPGQPVSNPDAKIIVPGAAAGGLDKEAKIWTPGQTAANPGAKIILP